MERKNFIEKRKKFRFHMPLSTTKSPTSLFPRKRRFHTNRKKTKAPLDAQGSGINYARASKAGRTILRSLLNGME
jgi:hypothetical protein